MCKIPKLVICTTCFLRAMTWIILQGIATWIFRLPDFESTPASKENPDKSITIFDYHRLLSEAGWKVTHRIECPLSSERLSGNHLPVRCTQTGVQKMQDKRILGTVGRTLLIAKRS